MNNWIKCSDRLPDENGEYLCFVKLSRGLWTIRIRQFNFNVWWSNASETKKVTHWQPLPSKPE